MIKTFLEKIKEITGENNEIVESTGLAINDRISSPFYGYFIISWLILNWKIPYSAFFIDQDIIFGIKNINRLDYISEMIPNLFSWVYLKSFIILPFLLTLFFFYIFPYVSRVFYTKDLKNKQRLELIKISLTKEKNEKETSLLKQEEEKVKVKKRIEKDSPEILWRKEFEEFQKTTIFSKFDKIIESFYQHSGSISWSVWDNGFTRDDGIEQDILVFADVNNLINLGGNKLTLTDKGKFFVRLYNDKFINK